MLHQDIRAIGISIIPISIFNIDGALHSRSAVFNDLIPIGFVRSSASAENGEESREQH